MPPALFMICVVFGGTAGLVASNATGSGTLLTFVPSLIGWAIATAMWEGRTLQDIRLAIQLIEFFLHGALFTLVAGLVAFVFWARNSELPMRVAFWHVAIAAALYALGLSIPVDNTI